MASEKVAMGEKVDVKEGPVGREKKKEVGVRG